MGWIILIIILLILGYLLFPFIRIYLKFRAMKKTFESQFGDIGAQFNDFTQKQQPKAQPTQKDKIFSDTDGEYVEFEEITPEEYSDNQNSNNDISRFGPQIEDAKWEDIK